jgi:CheY-like chemotaxis protein
MSAETIRRAFEPFFTTKEVGKGTGLGLSQVYGFATQSGGAAEIESEVGKGTSVVLTLPRSLREELPTAEPRRDVLHDVRDRGAAVLMVEDDDTVAAMVAPLIQELGYSCTRVASAKEALDRLAKGERYDIIFTDIVMPGGVNGLQLARSVRERDPNMPIVLTTGFSDAAVAAAAEFPVLRKPYQPEELERALAAGLRKAAEKRGETDGTDAFQRRSRLQGTETR